MNSMCQRRLRPHYVAALITVALLLWLPRPAHAAILDAPWTGSGTGTTTVVSDGSVTDPRFDYQSTGVTSGSWSFSAVAGSVRSVPVAWESSGYYAFFQVRATLRRFVRRNGVDVLVDTLVDAGPVNCCDSPSGGFDYTGTTTFDNLQPGDEYGFRLTGGNSDADDTLQGSLRLHEVDDTPPDVSAQVIGAQGTNGFYIGPVTLTWNVLEIGSRLTSLNGCAPAAVTDDTVGVTLTCEAKSHGGTTTRRVTIKKDSTAPELTVPAGITQSASVAAGRMITFAATATDAIDPAPSVTCSQVSGARFPVGDTTVSCTARDAAGNQTAKTFDLVVLTPPTLTSLAQAGKKTTRLTELKLRDAPSGASVDVTCTGRKCPSALKDDGLTLLNKGAVLNLSRLVKAPLPTGTKIVVTISGPTIVTTIETLTIRKGKKPLAGTTCQPAGATRPTAC